MTYAETVAFLYQQLPMYQRIGNAALKPNLDNTIQLCAALGQPQTKFPTVHVAGTNGKGSSSHMIAAILQSAGYKTGLYNSPHLKSFTERIRVNGQEIPETYVVQFVAEHRSLFAEVEPSFFEMTVALAFKFFAEEKVDVAVVEVGLGGRLDSTNIIYPVVSLITNIGFDHQALLGNDLKSIAGEKAGIIKRGTPAIISTTQREIAEVFENKANIEDASLFFADQEYQVTQLQTGPFHQKVKVMKEGEDLFPEVTLDLPGDYQVLNLPGVFKVMDVLRSRGFEITPQQLLDGLSQVKKLTHLKGRWQVLQEYPLVICDTGHNQDGIRLIVRQLLKIPCRQLRLVIGMVNDKDIKPILRLLPPAASYYFCKPNLPRGLEVEQLGGLAAEVGLSGQNFPSVEAAYTAARKEASPEDVVFIGGSTFVVAEIPDL